MRLLAVSGGQANGSVEILLKAALMAAEEQGVEARLLRLDDLRIPVGPAPGTGTPPPDDGPWFWEQLMECDALIVGAPIYSRTVPGTLRLLGDRVLGPNADVAFVSELIKLRDAGQAPAVAFRIDERVLRSRVGGFIAVGGSLTERWKTLALPLMHAVTFSLHIAVVDQVQFAGAGLPAAIVLDDVAIDRAALLGRNVAGQIGRAFDDVEYKGEAGVCPMCHLDVIVIRGSEIECATCGCAGRLGLDGSDASVSFTAEGCAQSVISLSEKRAHFFEVQETAARLSEQLAEIQARAQRFQAYQPSISPP